MIDHLYDTLAHFWSEPVVHANLIVTLHIIGALALGLIIGYERTYRGRAAGMRTYGLVCMSSAALTVIGGYSHFWFGGDALGVGPVDPTRVIQGIVTGIGFLGAGLIMKDGYTISGLTTAASIWAAAAIGMLIGVGFYLAAISLTVLSVLFMMWGIHIEAWLPARPVIAVTLSFKKGYFPLEQNVRDMVSSQGFEIVLGSLSIRRTDDQIEWHFVAFSRGESREPSLTRLATVFEQVETLNNFHLSHARN